MKHVFVALMLGAMGLPGAGQAQTMTTPEQIKPILEVVKPSWIAVRAYDGVDYVYFTQIVSWRCAIETIEYAINGGDFAVLETEPCYLDEANPHALRMETIFPFITQPVDSVAEVSVRLTFTDGSTDEAEYTRAQVQIN